MTGTAHGIQVVHLAGWTVLRVGGHHAALGQALGEIASPGARVVVDLSHTPADGSDLLPVLVTARSDVGESGHLVVVAHESAYRHTLRDAGIDSAESLEGAVGNDAPAVREAQRAEPLVELAPAQGDAAVVSAEDLLPRQPRA